MEKRWQYPHRRWNPNNSLEPKGVAFVLNGLVVQRGARCSSRNSQLNYIGVSRIVARSSGRLCRLVL